MPSRTDMLTDKFFDPRINEYVEEMSTEEPVLLKNLTVETETNTPMGSMICGPVVGQFLQLLISLLGGKKCLEIGTFTGYSALNMAFALPVDGHIDTLEINPDFAKIAQKYFNLSAHGHKIHIHLNPAEKTLPHLQPEDYDFIFIDADKQNYAQYFDLSLPLLKPGGIIMVDNALWGGHVINPQDPATRAIVAMNEKAKKAPNLQRIMLTVRDGLLILRKNLR